MKKQIQNKAINKIKLNLFKNFTIKDFFVLIIVIIIALIVVASLNSQINFFFKVLIFIAIFAFIGLPLLINFPSQNARGWQIFINWIKFVSLPRKYSSKSKSSNNTSNLVPYESCKNDFIYSNFGYVGGLKIQGFDLFAYDEDYQLSIFHQFSKIINNINHKISIIKIVVDNDIKANQDFFEQQREICLENNDENFCEAYSDDLTINFEGQTKFDYYVLVYGFEFKDLEFEIARLKSAFSQININSQKLKIEELLNLSIQTLNSNDKFPKEILQQIKNEKKNIAKYFALDEISWKSKYFTSHNKFFSFQSISELPLELPPYWANNFFNSNSNVIWNIQKIDEKEKNKILNKAHTILDINSEDKTQNIIDKKKGEFEQEAIENVIDIAATGQNLFYSTFLFVNSANSKEDLINLENQNSHLVKSIGAKIHTLRFKQLEAYINSFFRQKDTLKEWIEMPANNIAYGFPFTTREFNDGNYNVLGTNFHDGTPLFFDQFLQQDSRKNSNLFILGTSGSGKTTITKKLISYNLSIGNHVIILDPQNEYAKLGKLFNANIIHLNGSGQTVFNPLQIRKIFNPNDSKVKNTNLELLSLNISKLETFFKIIFPELNQISFMALKQAVEKLYEKFGFYELSDDITEYENTFYPTIDDLIQVVKEAEFDFLTKQEKNILLASLKSEFNKNSILGKMFNNHSTNYNATQNFAIFNVAALMQLDKKIYQSAFFLTLSFIQGEISDFYMQDNKKIILVVDEGHKFIDESNLFALNFLFDTAKTIRKYNGGLIITTQNPGDFAITGEAARKSEAIIENCQYSIFFNLKSKDIEKIDNLYKNVGGLSEDEKNFISLAQIGDFLLTVDSVNRFKLSAYYNDVEKSYFFDKGDKVNG
ncbi:conjugal transfer ATP-binding protein TraC [Mesomycoplasma conjunctivae]|uniref:TRSE-like protein n=1 Tax=Mesomycoplasma conjunctivae (strain ATCC 25834 / NCTC 10147 / HRC/581) TaxID=572263 RepID=C5J6G0_MESCH|nr:DUF87 domain-containing protein [Mesomycoplasma conjunctivae]CAT05052.1 TRSE-like protein [Mesomycoplasma conjunctivae]VEU66291.1 conjugal transfer ATP-binding protein TraC [Mesomycoplasma conjunctivae]